MSARSSRRRTGAGRTAAQEEAGAAVPDVHERGRAARHLDLQRPPVREALPARGAARLVAPAAEAKPREREVGVGERPDKVELHSEDEAH